MKLEIVYYTKGRLCCPICKSDQIKLVFTKLDKIEWIIIAVDKGIIQLKNDCSKSDVNWVCKSCYGVGIIA
jgi:hypothetical protein